VVLWVGAWQRAMARLGVPDRTDEDAAVVQLVADGFDVVDGQHEALEGTRRHRRPAVSELDRGRRARRGELHRACVLVENGIGVQTPAQALIEGLRTIDVSAR
jgi:hypothetical protein